MTTTTTEQTPRFSEPLAEPAFVIDTADRAEWLLSKLANLDAEADRTKANTAKRLQEIAADRAQLLYRFEADITAWARQEADRRRRKSVTLANGVISFRAVPARFAVSDEAAATEAARAACPAAVEAVTVTRLDRRALLDYVEATGELIDGVELIPASESVSIKTGSKE